MSAFVSEQKRSANRCNAQKSTGPRSAGGKARSSRNALDHGLFCKDVVIRGEDGELFGEIRRGMLVSYCPRNLAELALVERIVACHWKLRRCEQAEMFYYENGIDRLREKHQKRAMGQARRRAEAAEDEREELGDENGVNGDNLHERFRREAQEDLEEFWGMDPLPAGTMVMGYDLSGGPERERDSTLERFQRYAQRLENTIARCQRELERLRKMESKLPESAECPYVREGFAEEEGEEGEESEERGGGREGGGSGEGCERMRQNETCVVNVENEAKVKMGKGGDEGEGMEEGVKGRGGEGEKMTR